MKKLYLLLLFCIWVITGKAQVISADTVCVNTPVIFTSGTPGSSFTWAFDSINVYSSIVTTTTTKRVLLNNSSMQGGATPLRYDSSNGHYYAFWGNWNNNTTLYRMDFGTNPLSTPTVTTVSIAGMGFTGTDNGHLDLVYDASNSTWWLFWGGRGSGGSQLLRVNFGSSPANTPVSGSAMTFTELGYPFQITVKQYGNEWLLFSASNWGSVARFDFGSSLANTPTATTLPGTMANLGYFSLYEQDGSWYMVMVGTVSAKAWRYDFGANLKNSSPTLTDIGSTGGTTKSIRLLPNAVCSTQLFGYGLDEGSRLIRFDFQGNITTKPAISSMGNFFSGRPTEMSTFVYGDTIYAFASEFNNRNIVALPLVPLPAGAIQRYYNPEMTRTFTTPGIYTVTLLVDQGNPAGPSTFCKEIVVSAGVPPVTPGAFTDSQQQVCRGQQSVRYAIPPVPGAVAYTWSYTGIGAVINGSDTAVTVDFSPAATSGTLRVSAISNGTCGNAPGPARALAIVVNPLPAATITPAGTAAFCQGRSLRLKANSGSTLSYQWQQGAANVGSGDSIYMATAAGSYTVVVTDNGTRCSNVSAVTTLTENPSPGAAITPSGTVAFCYGDTMALSAAPAGAGLACQWLENNVPAGTGSATLPVHAPADYAVIVTNSYNCSDTSAPVTVTVHPLPVVTITPSGNTHICNGDQVVLQTGTGTGFSYTWKNGSTVVGASSSYTATTAGDYRVIVTDGNNCTDSSAALPVTVYVVPDVVITPGDTAFCAGGYVSLRAVSGATGLAYQWKKDGVDIPFASVSFYEVIESGDYTVVVHVPNVSGCTDSAGTVAVTVHPLPLPVISWDGNLLHTGSAYDSYQWYLDAQPLAGATADSYLPGLPGSYTVAVQDSNGCDNSASVYNLYRLITGLGDITALAREVRIYPNPAGALLHISAPTPVSITVYSPEGKMLIRQEHAQDIDIGGLAPGMYLVSIAAEDVLIKTEKLIKTAW